MYLTLAVLIAILSAATEVKSESPCDDDNGGCSHQCIYRGMGDNYKCGCPCRQELSPDNMMCETIRACDVDIYFAFDESQHVDPEGCSTSNFEIWEKWRFATAGLLELFLPLINTYSIGVQRFGAIDSPIDLADFDGTPSLQDAIDVWSSQTQPYCAGNWSYFGLISSVARGDVAGPGVLRPRDTTTRIAFGVGAAPDPTSSDEDILLARTEALEEFDELIVITWSQYDEFWDDLNTKQARLFACGNTTEPCPQVFWIDRYNDFESRLTLISLAEVIEENACETRKPPPDAVKVTSCDDGMTFEIELCRLRGMNISDLQLLNEDCDLLDYATFSADGLVVWITLSFGDCGMTQEYVEYEAQVKNQFQQILTTREIADNQTLIDVNLEATCLLDVFNEEYYVFARPDQETLTANATEEGEYPVVLNAYTSDQFSRVLTDLKIPVACPVFLQAWSPFPPGLHLVIWAVFATRSWSVHDDDSPVDLIADGCAVDHTVDIYDPEDPRLAQIKFDMFEYTETFKEPDEDKIPVYIHFQLYICAYHDPDPRCNPDCDRRKRRSVEAASQKTALMKTIGPFIVEPKEEDKSKELASESHDDSEAENPVISEEESIVETQDPVRRIELVLPYNSSDLSTSSFTQMLTLVTVVVAFILVTWILSRRVQKMSDRFNASAAAPFQQYSEQDIYYKRNSSPSVQPEHTDEDQEPPSYAA